MAWTDPELMKQWFAPLPFTTPVVEVDVRPGGSNLIVMRSPDGNEFSNRGVYLEVVENERLVFTDAYTKAWEPSEKPFMTVILTFENVDGKTRYTARVLHWTVADREMHEKMGFHEGWGKCTEFSPAISFVVHCENQDEVDHYWNALSAGGVPGQCGWLTDKFGVSWQIVPTALIEFLGDPDPVKSQRVMEAMLKMKKIDIAQLRQAHAQ